MSITALTRKRRKVIDIPEDVFRNLSVLAASEGKNLKTFIESILASEAMIVSDEELYKHLVETDPEGKEYLSDAEKKNFENWLGV
ncbi:hypothetical protein Barb7_02164 [Bacteroidales bacterium Barb7]|nr:hypothetical protein Barb7_02164 [Bacteroidales bacterium Barb7]